MTLETSTFLNPITSVNICIPIESRVIDLRRGKNLFDRDRTRIEILLQTDSSNVSDFCSITIDLCLRRTMRPKIDISSWSLSWPPAFVSTF